MAAERGPPEFVEALAPLPYHRALVAHLKAEEPEVWAWASSFEVQEQNRQDVRAGLLRDTYRLTAEAHPAAYAACHSVMARLGIDAPATLYQAGGATMNAALMYLPGEAHVILHGPILEQLSDGELLALMGHELAHYRLWSIEQGDFYTASRILDQTLANPGAAPSHVQSARLYGLYTEIYADRGAAFAADDAGPAITTLVKVHAGAATVDPAAYLAQAAELETADPSLSQGYSHPETFLRAQAVDRWRRGDPQLDGWLRRRLQGPLSLGRLDLVDQAELTRVTRGFIARFLEDRTLASEEVMTQVRRYFPDWRDDEPPLEPDALLPDRADDSVRDYLGFVMLDLALVDVDQRDHALLAAARAAGVLGRGDAFLEALKRDAKLGRREVDALARKLKAAA
ncbi:M48 family metalloprotease [Caulobacter sp. KR2-114]|uniref:M48 family metalloprotease n=1 Tax=Caulobacter sp. KR2-114 TaxID=3400912 RepID=UPI003C083AAA